MARQGGERLGPFEVPPGQAPILRARERMPTVQRDSAGSHAVLVQNKWIICLRARVAPEGSNWDRAIQVPPDEAPVARARERAPAISRDGTCIHQFLMARQDGKRLGPLEVPPDQGFARAGERVLAVGATAQLPIHECVRALSTARCSARSRSHQISPSCREAESACLPSGAMAQHEMTRMPMRAPSNAGCPRSVVRINSSRGNLRRARASRVVARSSVWSHL